MPDGEVAGVAASAAALLRFRQRLIRPIRRQVIVDRGRRKSPGRSNRSVSLDCHVSTRSLPGGSGCSPPDPCAYKFSAYSGIFSPGLEEGVCAAEGGRENARIRGEFVSARIGRATAGARQGTSRDMAIKTYRPVTPTRRFTTTTVNDDLTTNRPHKPLTEPKQRS